MTTTINRSPSSSRTSRAKSSLFLLTIVALTIAFAVGVAVGRFQFWPFPLLSEVYRIRGAALSDDLSAKDFVELKPLSAAQLGRVSTIPQVLERRAAIVKYIWPAGGFPSSRVPDRVESGFIDPKFQTSPNLLRITRLTTRMRGGIESISYYLQPLNSHQCLMVYYHGHGESFRMGKPTIDRLLKAGCAVVALSMPLVPGELVPVVSDSVLGSIPLRRHDQLAVLEGPDFSPIALFVEPVVASLNYALGKDRYSRTGMLGFSGGGWATTLYAALDERITKSYPVAGSEPIWLTVRRPQRWSDYEQTDVGLYRTANYPELYVLGTSGNRSQLQILNRFDACCFYGRGYLLYAQAVSETAAKIGGSFRVFLDETHREHKLSEAAMDTVLADFSRGYTAHSAMTRSGVVAESSSLTKVPR